MSEEENLDYEVVERDLNLEPEKFHIVKQSFRVLAALPAYIAVKIKERIKTRKQRKEAKKAIKAEKKARKLRWRKAFVQRVRSRFAKIATITKDFKHNWAMAGMSEEEKEQYRIEHRLVEQQPENVVPTTPAPAPENVAPEQPQQSQESTVIGEPTRRENPIAGPVIDVPYEDVAPVQENATVTTPVSGNTEPSQTTPAPEQVQPEIPIVAQGAHASYLESSNTVSLINEQIRTEIAKGSAADFELIGKYREQLKIEELNRDNHLEAYLGLISTKTVEHTAPVAETTQVQEEAKPRVSNRLHLGSAAQRVARRGLIARGTPDIIRTMKANVLKAQKQVVLKAKELLEQGKQILQPVEAPEVAQGLRM